MDIRNRLDSQWDEKARKMDWLGLEDILCDILRLPNDGVITDSHKLTLIKEAIDAYTKRGHFRGDY